MAEVHKNAREEFATNTGKKLCQNLDSSSSQQARHDIRKQDMHLAERQLERWGPVQQSKTWQI